MQICIQMLICIHIRPMVHEGQESRPDRGRSLHPRSAPAHRGPTIHPPQGPRPRGAPELCGPTRGRHRIRSRLRDDRMLGPEGEKLERAQGLEAMTLVYMDTGALIAMNDRSDRNHPAAVAYFGKAAREGT